jgi:RNA polymerase sigma-70 factor (ECF subfamily)
MPATIDEAAPLAARSGTALSCPPVSDSAAAWERQMVARITAGDDAALALVYDQYSALVHGIAVRLIGSDAADVCQEVFVSLWDNPQRWDPDRGSLRTFLAVIARRRSIDHLRRNGRRAANEQRAHHALPAPTPNVDEAALALVAGERVRAALGRLPDPQRQAIELAYFEGLTFTQVAARTGATEGTAKSRIRLGLQRLSSVLGPTDTVAPA